MEEKEKKRELLKGSRLKKTLIMEKLLLQCLSGPFIAKPPLHITKITKQILLQWGQFGETTKKWPK